MSEGLHWAHRVLHNVVLFVGLILLTGGVAVGGLLLHKPGWFLGVFGGLVVLLVFGEGAYRVYEAERKPQSAFLMGPAPLPRSPLERAVVRSLIAFEGIEREQAIQGEEELFDRLLECAGETDRRLEEAHAGALRAKFRQDGLHPPHGVDEQIAYLKRQIDLFKNALGQLRRDEVKQ
jgi:hypothetical protein